MIVSAVVLSALIFSGILLFRQSDHGDMMTRGKWLMKQGKVAFAVEEFERLVHIHKKSYEGHLELGKAYMEINETGKAAKHFRIASLLKARNLKESGAHVAISRLMIAQGKYEDARKQLFQAYNARPQNRKDPELLSALVDLYEDWGDAYMAENPPNAEAAFLKYSTSMKYVKKYDEQTGLQQKLLQSADRLADYYSNSKQYDKAIAVLKRTLHYEMRSDTLIAIAALYEQMEDLDKAIVWYRKAYERDPQVINLKLSSILVKKARELNEQHRPDEAGEYFAEAKKINETVKLPMNTLYPVNIANLELKYTVNGATFDMMPVANVTLQNGGNYPIQYLALRAFFLTGEDEKLAATQKVIATARDPLAANGEPKGNRYIEIKPSTSIPLEDLENGKLRLKLMVSYTDKPNSDWYEVKNAEIVIREAQHSDHPDAHDPV